jgi:hypothetical protein
VIRNIAQILDIIEYSKSGLGMKQYDWCYRLKPGSNQKTAFIRKRNKVFINMADIGMYGIWF